MLKVIKKCKKGFTLLELLVVVLIIGILAGIALPQYKMAVAKSQYATVKNITKNLFQSAERYYMTHDKSVDNIANLDIEYKLKSSNNSSDIQITLSLENDTSCTIWKNERKAACYKTIAGVMVGYYHTEYRKSCVAFSVDRDDIVNKLCRHETRKLGSEQGTYIDYPY